MTFEQYQYQASRTSKNTIVGGYSWIYPALGLAGEVGEVMGKMSKIFRDRDGKLNQESVAELKKELGDVLWFLSETASSLDLTLEEIAQENIAKLADRYARGVICGDGDNR